MLIENDKLADNTEMMKVCLHNATVHVHALISISLDYSLGCSNDT